MFKLFPLILILVSSLSWASATRTIDGDAVKSPGGGTTVTMPQASGTAMISAGITQETPTGSCNGSNTSFTLAHTPGVSLTLTLYLDGVALLPGSGNDYTISSATITLGSACSTGQQLLAVYSKY